MAATLNFSNFEFTAEQIRDINDLLFDEVLEAPELTLITTLYPGIVFDKEIGFIGEGDLVGKARQGCNPTPQEWKIGTRTVKWQPKAWEILLEECWTDLEATAAIYALNTGVDIADFTDTDYYAIIVQVLSVAIKKFIIRLVWFSDEDAANVSDGGIMNDTGVSLSVGTYRNTLIHTAMLRIFTKNEDSKKFVNQFIAGARVIAVFKNKEEGKDGDVKYEAYGWDNGLEISELTNTVAMTDTIVYDLQLASTDAAQEGSLPKSVFDTDLATTEAMLASLTA